MVLIVETGAGVPGANGLCTVAFVTSYLTERGRVAENLWSTQTAAVQGECIVRGADYIRTRWGPRFKGTPMRLASEGRAATGTLTLTGLPAANGTLTVGLKVYRVVSALTQENDVLIGATIAETIANIVASVNRTGDDTVTHELTLPNYEASAKDEAPVAKFTALSTGAPGNEIALATDMTNASVSGATLTGGVDETPQPLPFPRTGLYRPSGQLVVGVPLEARQANAEYAVRALLGALAPDPTVNADMTRVESSSIKIGPIELSDSFGGSGIPFITKPFPAADRLLQEFVHAGGGVFR